MFKSNRLGLASAAMLMLAASSTAQAALPAPRKGSARDYKPTPPRQDGALAQEIAAHNEAVERLKAEKKARKQAR